MPLKKNKDETLERDAKLKMDKIDETLAAAYKPPKEVAFSQDRSIEIIQKGVLYHRIRGDQNLREGVSSPENDKKYNEYADAITSGKDPVVEYIKTKPEKKRAELLVELTKCDKERAFFEDMIMKGEASKIPEEEEPKEEELENKRQESRPDEEKLEEEKTEEKKLDPPQAENIKLEEDKKEEVPNPDEIKLEDEKKDEKVLENEKPEEKKPGQQNPEENKEAKSEENKAEDKKDSAADQKKKEVPETTAEKMKKEEAELKNAMYKKLADSENMTTTQFLSDPENTETAMKLLAVEHYNNMVKKELEEFELTLAHDSPENRKKAMENRPPFDCEKKAAENYEAYMESLRQSPEVLSAFQRLATRSNIKELGDATANAFENQKIYYHSNASQLDKTYIPGTIKEYLKSADRPEKGSKLEKKLNNLSCMKGNDMPEPPSPEDYEKRMKEYKDILKELEKEGKFDTPEGKQLKETLEQHVQRLEDNSLQPDREKVGFDYKPDMYIDYYDPKDPDHKSMDAMEAREKLIRGEKLVQESFGVNDFVGKSQELKFDKKTGQIVRGKEKLITRPVDLSEETKKNPDKQIEDLKKIKDVLNKSDPFYVKNSESYKKTMASLDKVIEAHENLGKDANVRQSKTLKDLYDELDKNVNDYLGKEAEQLKSGDKNGQIRKDAMQTLQSITNKDHVNEIASKLYPEQAELDRQNKLLKPLKKPLDKWKGKTPANDKEREEFKKDFKELNDKLHDLKGKYGDLPYLKMGIAEDLENFVKKAEDVQKQTEKPENKIDQATMDSMKDLSSESNEALKDLYAMNPDAKKIKPEEVKKEENEKKGPDNEINVQGPKPQPVMQ